MKINYKTKPRSVAIENVQDGDYILINTEDVSNTEGSPIYKLHNPKIMDGAIHWSNNKKTLHPVMHGF